MSNCEQVKSYDRALDNGQRPTIGVIVAALKVCGTKQDLKTGQRIHRQLLLCGDCKDLFVLSSIVNMYAKCGCMESARRVFEVMQHRSIVTWNCIITGYAKNGEAEVALKLFYQMQDEDGYAPNRVGLLAALKACANLSKYKDPLEVLELGKSLHLQAASAGCEMDDFVASALVEMYAKCGSIDSAHRVFARMPHRDTVLWNCLLCGYVEHGEADMALTLFSGMRSEGCIPSALTFLNVLKACTLLGVHEEAHFIDGKFVKLDSLRRGREVHALANASGYGYHRFVASSLIEMYSKCGCMSDACRVFDGVLRPDAVMWTGMIQGYADNKQGELALQFYRLMQKESVVDAVATVSALKACMSLAEEEENVIFEGKSVKRVCFSEGAKVHAVAVESGHELNPAVASSLVDMYAKAGFLEKSRDVFERMPMRDVISWTSIISAHIVNGECLVALDLYERMQEEGFVPDVLTVVAALKACGSLAETVEGKLINGKLVRFESMEKGRKIHSSNSVKHCSGGSDRMLLDNALLNMYSKCGSMGEASLVFDGLQHPDVISWNCMLMGYANNGENERALECYYALREKLKPSPVTFIAAFKACAKLAEMEVGSLIDGKYYKVVSLQKGRNIHAHLSSCCRLDETDTFVGNTLVDMYGKCGSMSEAWSVFKKMACKDLISWNCLLLGYASWGEGRSTLSLYHIMRDEARISVNEVTFVARLKACGSLGDLETGKDIHSEAQELGYGSHPVVTCSLIDFYGKCGSMEDAERVFESIPASKRCIVSWNSLLAGYSRHGDTWKALALFERLRKESFPDAITFQAVLSACSHAGLVEVGKAYFHMMSAEYGIAPGIEHYACMVDLLGRANMLEAATMMVKYMPYEPNRMVWMVLLGACRKWKNVNIAWLAFNEIVKLDKGHAPAYVLMANICACAGITDIHM